MRITPNDVTSLQQDIDRTDKAYSTEHYAILWILEQRMLREVTGKVTDQYRAAMSENVYEHVRLLNGYGWRLISLKCAMALMLEIAKLNAEADKLTVSIKRAPRACGAGVERLFDQLEAIQDRIDQFGSELAHTMIEADQPF